MSIVQIFLRITSTTAINNTGTKALPVSGQHSLWTLPTLPVHTAPCSSCPHTSLHNPDLCLWDPTHLSVPIVISLGIVAQTFSRYINLIAISSCPSSFFSTNYLWANIPCVVPLPCLNSSCSSPNFPYTIALILPSRFFPAT